MITTLSRHIGIAVVALHAILLPLLYFGLEWTVRTSYEDNFVNRVRAYTKLVSEELEANTIANGDEGLVSFLDSLALSGELNYAVFVDGDHIVHSSLLPAPKDATPPPEDYAFGSRGDDTYYLSSLSVTNGHQVTLRLGFDERPTIERISNTMRGVLLALLAYVLAILLAAWLFSLYLARPLKELRIASRRIASGDFSQRLSAHSNIQEMSDLATDLETMREELVGVNTRLAKQIEERSQLEFRLRQKQRLETVGTLAGGVAHEFNNILVPMTLYTEIALEKLGPEHPAHAELQRVMSAVRRATSVVSKILTFGRHFEHASSDAVNIAPAVDEGLRLFAALRPTDIQIQTAIAANCRPVVADPTLIVQIVMNLCTNAYQAMRSNGGTLRVELRDVEMAAGASGDVLAGSYVELLVADTGHGMDEATRDRIFEPFFTTRDVGEGTGLGLSVVHGIVTSMGATIQVTSEPGKGAVFRMLMPAVANAQKLQGATHASSADH
jgi:signal transduction histidine kinase